MRACVHLCLSVDMHVFACVFVSTVVCLSIAAVVGRMSLACVFVVCEVSTHKGGCSSIMGDIWVISQSRHIDPPPPSLFIYPHTMTKGRHLPGIYTLTENKQDRKSVV